MFVSTAFVALAFSTLPVFANVFITAPVQSTTWTGGQQASLTWQDDGTSPSLASFGAAKVGIYAGNAQQQTLLQEIVDSVDVSTTASIVFTPNTNIGPDGDQYFVRFDSLGLKSTSNAAYPAQAFSARFTLTGMTGTFNASVQSEISGQSTAPIAAPSSAPSGASTPQALPTTSAIVTTAVTSAKASQTASSQSANGASGLAAASFTVIVGVGLAALGNTLL